MTVIRKKRLWLVNLIISSPRLEHIVRVTVIRKPARQQFSMISLSFIHLNINIRLTALDALGQEATERDHVILRFIERQQQQKVQVHSTFMWGIKNVLRLKFPVKWQHILQNPTWAASWCVSWDTIHSLQHNSQTTITFHSCNVHVEAMIHVVFSRKVDFVM